MTAMECIERHFAESLADRAWAIVALTHAIAYYNFCNKVVYNTHVRFMQSTLGPKLVEHGEILAMAEYDRSLASHGLTHAQDVYDDAQAAYDAANISRVVDQIAGNSALSEQDDLETHDITVSYIYHMFFQRKWSAVGTYRIRAEHTRDIANVTQTAADDAAQDAQEVQESGQAGRIVVQQSKYAASVNRIAQATAHDESEIARRARDAMDALDIRDYQALTKNIILDDAKASTVLFANHMADRRFRIVCFEQSTQFDFDE
jgi:hypothetical protein